MLEWIQVVVPIAGGFFAAWYGATLALRKSLRDLALSARVSWYEETIRSIGAYEEVLERLRANYLHVAVVKSVQQRKEAGGSPPASGGSVPLKFRPEPDRWKELVDAEVAVRQALQLHGIYTTSMIRTQCSVALNSQATLAKGQWFDLGPAPEIQGTDLISRMLSLRNVRSVLEGELRRILQYDGWLRSVLPWLNRWLVLRDLQRQKKNLAKSSQSRGSDDPTV